MWKRFEKKALREGFFYPCGVDEAGRGPLAGPVVAACLFLPLDFDDSEIDDSKKLQPHKRREVYKKLLQAPRVDYGIGIVSHEEIDLLNILQATFKAFEIAVSQMKRRPDLLFIDGNQVPPIDDIAMRPIVGGDACVKSIAGASIIAKEVRDAIMCEYDLLYPQYGFKKHKGYPTPEHREAILKWGPSPIHRKSFTLLREEALQK